MATQSARLDRIEAMLAALVGEPIVSAPVAPVAASPVVYAATTGTAAPAEYTPCDAVHAGPFTVTQDGATLTFGDSPCQRVFRTTSTARAIDGVAAGGHAPLFINS